MEDIRRALIPVPETRPVKSHRLLRDGKRHFVIQTNGALNLYDEHRNLLHSFADTGMAANIRITKIVDETEDGRYVLFSGPQPGRRRTNIVIDTEEKRMIPIPDVANTVASAAFGVYGTVVMLVKDIPDHTNWFLIITYNTGNEAREKEKIHIPINLAGEFACDGSHIAFSYRQNQNSLVKIGLCDTMDGNISELFEFRPLNYGHYRVMFATPNLILVFRRTGWFVYNINTNLLYIEEPTGIDICESFVLTPDGRYIVVNHTLIMGRSDRHHHIRPLVIEDKETQDKVQNRKWIPLTSSSIHRPLVESIASPLTVIDYTPVPLVVIETERDALTPPRQLTPYGYFTSHNAEVYIPFNHALPYPIFTVRSYLGAYIRLLSNDTIDTHDTYPNVFLRIESVEAAVEKVRSYLIKRGLPKDAMTHAIRVWSYRSEGSMTLKDAEFDVYKRMAEAMAFEVGLY